MTRSWWIVCALLCSVALSMSACASEAATVSTGSDPDGVVDSAADAASAVAEDSAPGELPTPTVPSGAAGVPASCAWSGEVDADAVGDDRVALAFDDHAYRPGDIARFDWTVGDGIELITGDEWFVECWDGASWQRAWIAFVYGPEPDFSYLRNDMFFTDDGYSAARGGVLVPPDAPDGLYRVFHSVPIWEDGRRTDALVEARFAVSSNGLDQEEDDSLETVPFLECSGEILSEGVGFGDPPFQDAIAFTDPAQFAQAVVDWHIVNERLRSGLEVEGVRSGNQQAVVDFVDEAGDRVVSVRLTKRTAGWSFAGFDACTSVLGG